ncbi:MAG: hypothetical protein QMD46_12370 [Methanomicrobiales archaeon]|nr:hypothetical protein [Methanomicrobiales archaeon]
MSCPVSCCTCGDPIGFFDVYEIFTYSEGTLVGTRLVAVHTEDERDAMEEACANGTDGETVVQASRLCRIYNAEQAEQLRDLLDRELAPPEGGL